MFKFITSYIRVYNVHGLQLYTIGYVQEWNNELAQVAQAYSQRCMFEHNPSRTRQAPSFSSVGENLAIAFSSSDNYEQLFNLWHDERNVYNFNTNGCSDVCGHYTQVKLVAT